VTRSSAVVLAVVLTACGSSNHASGPQTHGNCTPASATLSVYQGASFNCSSGTGITLNGSNATYLVVPQFATGNVAYDTTTFQIERHGAGSAAAEILAATARFARTPYSARNVRQIRFDGAMRTRERRVAASAAASRAASRSGASAQVARQTLGSSRTFWVFADTLATIYKQITATVVYAGTSVDVYLDNASPAGFTAQQLNQFGTLADQVLYSIVVGAFAPPTDIDHNGHVIMLLTPAVNALTPAADCSTQGFVAGYFDPNDLSPSSANSNAGEIFYGLVPDPNGQAHSCTHSVSDIFSIIPGTFMHELQHMISFGQHVLIHGGGPETGWLDEGMSIVATELGGLHYDSLYQASGNTAYADSASPYISEQFNDSFDYLANPDTASLTLHSDADCCLEWRGGDWLMMRYIGDQKGKTVYHTLETSTDTGTANIAAATQESFPSIFGTFGVAVFTDSLPGVPISAIPSQYQFATWRLRAVYSQISPNFPIQPITLSANSATNGKMVPGTSSYYQISTPSGSNSVTIVFGTSTGAFSSNLNPQVLVFRMK
jgi:hypothetical protein